MQEDPAKRKESTPRTDGPQESQEPPAEPEEPVAEAAPAEGEAAPSRPKPRGDGEEGMHIPGVLPEQEVVESEHEMSPGERAILKDLEESLPEDARETEGPETAAPPAAQGAGTAASGDLDANANAAATASTEAAAATATEPEKPLKKPMFPWWFSMLLYGGIGAWAIYSGLTRNTTTVWRVVFVGIGLYLLWGAWEAVRDRNKGQQAPAGTPTEQVPQKPEQPQSPP